MRDEPHRAPGLTGIVRGLAEDTARQATPWRAGQSWWVVAIEGVVALLIGIYVLSQPERATDIIHQLIAVVLLIVSVEKILDGFRFRLQPVAPWDTMRGGAGATVAALTLLSPLSPFLRGEGSRQILGYGLMVYAIIGIIAAFATRRHAGFKWGTLIGDVLTLVLGFVLVARDAGEVGGTQLLAWVLIIGGVALILLAMLMWARGRSVSSRPAP